MVSREDNVETLLSTACLMLLHEVVEACSRFLAHQLHPSNCLGIAIFAEHQSCISLLSEANAYTHQHFMQVILNQEFLQLNVDQMCSLLSSDDLNVSCEEQVFNALMSWIQHDPDKRCQSLKFTQVVWQILMCIAGKNIWDAYWLWLNYHS